MNFPSRVSQIRSASFRTDRCRDTAAGVMLKWSAISPADSLPDLSRFRISRRVGSDRAFRVCCNAKEFTSNRIFNN